MNKLILFLSKAKSEKKEPTFNIKIDEPKEFTFNSNIGEFKGINSNDAPTKYILKSLKNSNQTLNQIVCIVTEQSKNDISIYKDTVTEYCKELNVTPPTIESVPYDGNSATIKSITEKLNPEDNVYIDTTGGLRDTCYTLLLIAKFMEYANTTVKTAVYGNVFEKTISDITPTYRLFNLISGAENFTSFGNCKALSDIFKDSKNAHIKELIDAMEQFSDAMTLCQTKDIDSIFCKLKDSLNELKDNIDTNDNYELLFYQLVEPISKKFGLDKDTIDYLNIIRWCLDNNLIQQAITIYTDKIPKYFHNKGYFNYSDKALEEAKSHKTKNDIDYEILYNGFLQMKSETIYSTNLKEILKNSNVVNCIISSKDYDTFKKTRVAYKIDLNNPEIRNGICNIIRLKKAMYMADCQISADNVQNNLKDYPILQELSKRITASNVKGMINNISNDEVLISNLQRKLQKGETLEAMNNINKSNDRISVIDSLENYLKNNTSYYIAKNVDLEDFKTVLRDYVYVKNNFRNIINHAGDEVSISTRDIQYFKDHGYYISENFTVSKISEAMNKVLNNIEKL